MWWRRSRGACSRRAVPHVVVPLVAEEPPASRHAADCGAAGWIGVRLRHAAAHGGIPRDAIGHVCRAMSHSGVSLVTEGAPVSRPASDCGTARRGWSASVVRCRTVVYLSSREGFQCRALPRVVVALVVEGALVSRVAGWCGAAGRIGGCLRRASPQVLVKRGGGVAQASCVAACGGGIGRWKQCASCGVGVVRRGWGPALCLPASCGAAGRGGMAALCVVCRGVESRHAGGGLCLWGFGGVGWCATRRWVAWVVGVGVGFLLAAAHGLPGCPGGFGGCVWWFENSIVCTVLLHHAAMLLVVWWSFDCQSDARPCGTRGGLMGVGVFV